MSKSPSRRTSAKFHALPADVIAAVRAAADKKAEQLTLLDLRKAAGFTDFFVIATGRNARQTKAIYDEVSGVLKREHDLLPRASAGAAEATWIVADYLDVVLHLFTPETRGFYRLEELWSEVPSIELEVATA